MKSIVIDKLEKIAKRHINHAGYLVAPNSAVARSGILYYSAGSLPFDDGKPEDEMVAVYRPPSEVIKAKAKYANMPITYKHPDQLEVSPETAKGLQRGTSGSVIEIVDLADGEVEVRTDVIVTDIEAIKNVQSKKVEELSVGYYTQYKKAPGTTPSGVKYDYIQYDLIPNHIALVEEGRCGSSCKVADSKKTKKEKDSMEKVLVEVNGKRFEVDAALATELETLNSSVADMEKEPTVVLGSNSSADADGEEDDDKTADGDKEEYVAVTEDEDEDEDDDKTPANDSLEGMISIDIPGKGKAVADARTVAYITELENKKSATPVNDSFEVAKVTSVAHKVLGKSFTLDSVNSVNSLKKAIIAKVFPVVDSKSLKSDSQIALMYKTAVDTFEAKSGQFGSDLNFLTGGSQAADGKQNSGAAGTTVFAQMGKQAGINIATTDSSGVVVVDPHANRKIKFLNKETK